MCMTEQETDRQFPASPLCHHISSSPLASCLANVWTTDCLTVRKLGGETQVECRAGGFFYLQYFSLADLPLSISRSLPLFLHTHIHTCTFYHTLLSGSCSSLPVWWQCWQLALSPLHTPPALAMTGVCVCVLSVWVCDWESVQDVLKARSYLASANVFSGTFSTHTRRHTHTCIHTCV